MANIIILVIGILAVVAGFSLFGDYFKAGVALMLIGFLVAVGSQSFKIIPTGSTGVRSVFGQVNKNYMKNALEERHYKICFR